MFAALTQSTAFISMGRNGRTLATVSLATGAERRIGIFHDWTQAFPSPNGEWIATFRSDYIGDRPSKVKLIARDGSTVRAARLGPTGRIAHGELLWVATNRFVWLPWGGDLGTAKVYDMRLNVLDRFDWYAFSPVLFDGDIYGLAGSDLMKKGFPDGATRVVGRALIPWPASMDVIPDDVSIAPEPRPSPSPSPSP